MPDLVRVRVAFCALRRVVGDFTSTDLSPN
jgi:hypothetical protein